MQQPLNTSLMVLAPVAWAQDFETSLGKWYDSANKQTDKHF